MSSSESFQFSNMNDYTGEGSKSNGGRTDKTVCQVSVVSGFILTFLSVAIAIGIGIIVNFAGNNKSVTCSCRCGTEGSTPYPPGVPAACKLLALEGNQELCGLCPGNITSTTVTTPTTVPTTTAPPPAITTDILLPTSLKPHHYDLTLRPELYNGLPETFNFSGKVVILLECISSTDNITLHIATQNLTSKPVVHLVGNSGAADPVVEGESRDKDREFLIIHLDRALSAGQMYSLTLEFTDKLTDNLLGLYLSSYQNEGSNETKYLAVTQFQHTFARNTFPCFDEPALKAKFSITLERQPQIITLSNMPINRTETLSDGYEADIYDETVTMPTYLVAFTFCDFLNVTNTTAHGVEFGVLSRPEYINLTSFALTTGIAMLDAFEDYFNISYALSKVDNIALPDFYYGAMENWGLVTYREAYLLYEKGVTTTRYMEFIAEIIAHELAHMWFGNLVTPVWWDDIWLNEGFATFLSYLCMDMVFPDWKMMELIATYEVQYVMEVDSYESTVPIYRMAYTPREIEDLFDSITYNKGASVIRMMWFFLGEETFKKGLVLFLREHSYGSATHEDLWRALQTQADNDGMTEFNVKTVMDTWIKQKNFPVVTVTRKTGQLDLTQKRFLLSVDNSTTSTGYNWEIPFTYTTNQETNFSKRNDNIKWMRTNTDVILDSSINATSGWIIGNVQQYGYYRVNYDNDNWNALVQQLKTDHEKIHLVNRGALISDAWALAKAGLNDMGTAWDMLIYLRNETEYIPWNIAEDELGYVDLMLTGRAAYGNFERFVVRQIEGRPLDVTIDDDRPVQERSLSSLIFRLACKHYLEECTTRSLEMFNDWRVNGTLIPPDIKGTVMCTAIREGGEDEWNYVYNRYHNGPVSESPLILAAMGCSHRPWLNKRYLEYTLQEDRIRKQDFRDAILSVIRNPVAFHTGWNFLMVNWKEIVMTHGGDGSHLNTIIVIIAQRLYTSFDLGQIEYWRDTIHPQDVLLSGFDRAIDRIKVNMDWEKHNYQFIEEWLETNTE